MRVIALKRPALSVSRLMLMRLTPAALSCRRVAVELRTVGRDHQIVEAGQGAQAFDQPQRILAHQRLAAGDAQLIDAEADK
jgi:hypothetical protein